MNASQQFDFSVPQIASKPIARQATAVLITLGAGNVHEAGSRIAADLKILEEMRGLMPPGEIDGKL